jgi:hypothetical protein
MRTIAAMPHTWAVATTVVPVSELIRRDFEFEEIVGLIAAHRLMVPTVMAKTYNRASLEIVRHDHRPNARKVEGGARQCRPYVDVETQVRPIAPSVRWAARPSTAVLAYLACMGTDLGL